ncbi:MAG: glycerophosphodiester phosphodiesterase [Lachnospiraceae bacterium]|nr:glycerophosphodiester phosphodiesterase [Lachnospiraceae bacterium]
MTVVVICLIFIIWLTSLLPNERRQDRMKEFEGTYYAHRGLFNNDEKEPENSMIAFKKAVLRGYGIELDVRLTKDEELVVFHDATLRRMCRIDKKVVECNYDELSEYKLLDSDETIPKLEEVIKEIDGQVPLIVEIKANKKVKKITKKLSEIMEGYKGNYCIKSFNPYVLFRYRMIRPEVLRGQLSMGYLGKKAKTTGYEVLFISCIILNLFIRPDFISVNYKMVKQWPYRLCKKLCPVTKAGWTIRSKEELMEAEKYFQMIIFDSFIPNNKKV